MSVGLFVAAFLLPIVGVFAQSTIYSGQGFATEYYDIEETEVCGWSYETSNKGNVACSPMNALSLSQIGSNYLVAINNTLLHTNLSLYCGKRIIVWFNGVPSSQPLFVGDGCQRCSIGSSRSTIWDSEGDPGIDLSHRALQALSGNACNLGHVRVTWEVIDEEVFSFTGNASGIIQNTQPQATASTKIQTSVADGASSVYAPSPGTTCEDNVWKCNGKSLEQCIRNTWTPRSTCPIGTICKGGNEPYCG